jgi:hypothetical protein
MKHFFIPVLILTAVLILSACGAGGPPATPTINPVDLQSTMMSAALRIVAETQAAIPTATLQPTATTTNTPVPTATFPPMPSPDIAFTPLPGGNSAAGDPCIYQTLPAPLVGDKIRVRIDNPTSSTLMVSVNLQQTGPQSLCGYRGYSLAAHESLVLNDLVVGCYTLWAWNPDPQDYFMVTNGTSCLDTSNSWTFDVTPNGLNLR